MSSILLIDADSKIPNIALMKLSTYYKQKGYNVDLLKLNMPYYPTKKKKYYDFCDAFYEKVFCSVVFSGNIEYINSHGNVSIEFGGSGYSLEKKLPSCVDDCELDYSIYDETEFSYGFITRGCIRNCEFCIVPQKEGKLKFYNSIDSIVKHKKIKFLDNNILAYDNHLDILQEIIDKKLRCCFIQGLDIRLLTEENSELLRQIKYIGEYIFAFDNINYEKIIERKLKLIKWAKDWRLKFYVYVNADDDIHSLIYRVEYLRNKKILPYVMRDINCYDSVNKDFYTDFSAYCNQPSFFKKMSFEVFLNKRHKKIERINKSIEIYKENK